MSQEISSYIKVVLLEYYSTTIRCLVSARAGKKNIRNFSVSVVKCRNK